MAHPPNRAEQEAIAETVDAEIDGLEAQLAKARSLKQGMMQETLRPSAAFARNDSRRLPESRSRAGRCPMRRVKLCNR